MDNSEIEECLSALGEPKLHGGMCKALSSVYVKASRIFPELEAARPRGIQALCSLHIALEKTKTLLQHCAESSKLYLAITGDSVVLKFEKARSALSDGLRRVEDIVPQTMASRVSDILRELDGIEFLLNPSEKQVGDDVIGLLQQGKRFDNGSDGHELETFRRAVSRLGITSSRAALEERRALKQHLEKAHVDDDKRKESIVAYLSHLTRQHSKTFRTNDGDDSRASSPDVEARELSKTTSFGFKPSFRGSGQPPEGLRCPISLQLMYDPVVIESGQTYERACIEKWFGGGHNTCPKSQQELTHLGSTPNYCVKGLVASWCKHNGFAVPHGPPDSLDLNYWTLAESAKTKSTEKGVKVVPLDGPEPECESFTRYGCFLKTLNSGDSTEKCEAVERIRGLLKNDEEARISMGGNGFVEALLRFLESAVREGNAAAQESGAMALFNLAVNNRNKETMLASGVLWLLAEMSESPAARGPATALYLNLSCLEQAKPAIGSAGAVPFLVDSLRQDSDTQCKIDALHALYNLSACNANVRRLVSSGILDALRPLILDHKWAEKAIAVVTNLALTGWVRDEIVSAHGGLVSGITAVLDVGEPEVQEQAAACLLILCTGNQKCSQMVLQEGVIPCLVLLSVNGTTRGKQKAQKLLMLFREQRCEKSDMGVEEPKKPLSKSTSMRKTGRALSFWWKNKSFSVHRF